MPGETKINQIGTQNVVRTCPLILTVSVQVYHGDDHEQRVPVELRLRVGVPPEAAQVVARPDPGQHHGGEPGRLYVEG